MISEAYPRDHSFWESRASTMVCSNLEKRGKPEIDQGFWNWKSRQPLRVHRTIVMDIVILNSLRRHSLVLFTDYYFESCGRDWGDAISNDQWTHLIRSIYMEEFERAVKRIDDGYDYFLED